MESCVSVHEQSKQANVCQQRSTLTCVLDRGKGKSFPCFECCRAFNERYDRISVQKIVAFKYNITANGVSKHEKGRAGKPRSLGTSSASIFEKETVCHGCYAVPSLEFKQRGGLYGGSCRRNAGPRTSSYSGRAGTC